MKNVGALFFPLLIGIATASSALDAQGPAAPSALPLHSPAGNSFTSVSPHPSAARDADGTEFQSIIHKLGDDRFAVRESAEQDLLAQGRVIRQEILQASETADLPEVRVRCKQILLKLPWWMPGDPPSVVNILDNYDNPSAEKRMELVQALQALGLGVSYPALVRLMREDPCYAIRWRIASLLLESDPTHTRMLRQRRPDDDPSASAVELTVTGAACLNYEPLRGLQLIHRAAKIEAREPTEEPSLDGAIFDLAVWNAARTAEAFDRLDEAADLLRLAARHDWIVSSDGDFSQESWQGESGAGDQVATTAPRSVELLFALHANYGPLPGFDQDVARYQHFLATPEIAYCLGRLNERLGRWMPAQICYAAARASASMSADKASHVADFLLRERWNDLGINATQDLLASCGASDLTEEIGANSVLEELAAARHDYDAAILHLQAILDICSRNNQIRLSNPETIQVQLNLFRAEQAMAKGNKAAVEKAIPGLLQQKPDSPDMAIELYWLLKNVHHDADADKVFIALYQPLSERLTDDPGNLQAMNNLAWLCARCGQHIDEAVKLSDQFIAAMPGNFAFLDTAAECNFAAGNKARAVQLESEAVLRQPRDIFLRSQLKRFSQSQ